MINSYLGKFFLIALLIFATCINKFLGIFVVFVLFLMYYKRNNYTENFETVKASDNQNTSSLANKLDSSKINVITTNLSSKIKPTNATTTTTTTTPVLDSIKNGSGEGVDLQSTETNIIRGKQSNSIPIREKTKEAVNNVDSIMPYDKSNFTEEFSIL